VYGFATDSIPRRVAAAGRRPAGFFIAADDSGAADRRLLASGTRNAR
jgi:hypothetical protein